MFRTLATIVAAVAVLAFPAGALALHAPMGGGYDTSYGAGTSVPANYLRDGKYLPAPTAATAPVQVVRVVRPVGFDFRDAAIGGLVGAGGIALLGGLVLVARRGREHGAAGAAHV